MVYLEQVRLDVRDVHCSSLRLQRANTRGSEQWGEHHVPQVSSGVNTMCCMFQGVDVFCGELR